jgi:hypothetical protein
MAGSSTGGMYFVNGCVLSSYVCVCMVSLHNMTNILHQQEVRQTSHFYTDSTHYELRTIQPWEVHATDTEG